MGKFDGIVREFFEQQQGEVIVISEDALLFRTLRTTVQKLLAVKTGLVSHFADMGPALKKIRMRVQEKLPAMLFVERILRGKPTTEFLINVKQAFPEVYVIVLTEETRRDNLVYLHEIGVNSLITKPASVDNLIEKMAFTLKPQGNLTQMVDQAKDHIQRGELDKAMSISDKILEIKPNSPIGLMLRGDAYLGMGRRDDAIKAYEEAHASSSMFLEPLKRLAEAYSGTDEHDSQLKYLKKLDKLSPLNSDRKFEIGKVYTRKGEMKMAEVYFDEAIECATKEVFSTVGNMAKDIAHALDEMAPNLSEKYLSQFLEFKGDRLTRDDMETFNRLGIALRRQGKWKAAVENYQKALTIAPDDEGLFYNMAMAHLEGGRAWDAAQALDKAAKLNPGFFSGSADVCYNMGYVYYQNRDNQKALEFFNKALEINPEHAHAQDMLTRTRKRM